MLQLKQNKLLIEDFGCKKDLIQPNFNGGQTDNKIELFEELDQFKKLAAKAAMDDEREEIKENLNRDANKRQWLKKLAIEIEGQN